MSDRSMRRVAGFFAALPSYLGGKRRLCPVIFALLATEVHRSRWRGRTFVDPFLGGGSVSLFAKAQGFEVISNDVALRSAAIGRALIANGSETLTSGDVGALLREPSDDYPRRAEEQFSPGVFPEAHARLLDRALHNLLGFQEPRRSLAVLMVVKWALRIQPMGMLRGTDARAAFSGDLDRVSPRRLGHYMKSQRLLTPEAWLSLAQEANAGVFPGRGEAHQMDVLDFLDSVNGDVVYLDPPYPGTSAYEQQYSVLDDLLEGKRRPISRFSESPEPLGELFSACRHIPVWLVSFGNAAMDLSDLVELIREHRGEVRAFEIPYLHLGGLASDEKNAANREHLVLATE